MLPPENFKNQMSHKHYTTINTQYTYNCISEVIPTVQVTFFVLVRIFRLNFSFYLNSFFLSWENTFGEL